MISEHLSQAQALDLLVTHVGNDGTTNVSDILPNSLTLWTGPLTNALNHAKMNSLLGKFSHAENTRTILSSVHETYAVAKC